MLTKKEKILVRPWIVQRYQSHREKVKSARPAIDFVTPHTRPHVKLNHKKKQMELERKGAIEKENVRLLQQLVVIMNKLRLDNYWKARPRYQKRELIYKPKSANNSREQSQSVSPEVTTNLRGSAKRCLACNKSRVHSNKIHPES